MSNKNKATRLILAAFLFNFVLHFVDYATGLAAAKYRAEKITSYKGYRGIAKKICMWLLVGVGAIIDFLIAYSLQGYEVQWFFLISIIVCVWLMCNEIISILENMKDIGVSFPPFLLRITQNIKSKVEEMGNEQADKTEKRK